MKDGKNKVNLVTEVIKLLPAASLSTVKPRELFCINHADYSKLDL
jgi:hypothetical protein